MTSIRSFKWTQRAVVVGVGYWLASMAILWRSGRGSLQLEFYFDEAWRADIIHANSPIDRMRAIKTPIPPLWPLVLNGVARVVPRGFTTLRLLGMGLAATFPTAFGLLIRHWWKTASPNPHQVGGVVAGLGGVFAVGSMLDGVGLADYLNDYSVQSALTVMFVTVWYVVDQGKFPAWPLIPAALLIGVGTISGLFVLPAFVAWAWTRRTEISLRITGGAATLGGVAAATLYVVLYRGQIDAGLTNFWANDVLGDGLSAERFLRSIGRLVAPHPIDGAPSLLIGLLCLASGIAGLVVIWRRWRWFSVAAISAWLICAAASVVGSWPLTVVRVNLPFLWMWLMAMVAAPAAGLWSVARRPVAVATLMAAVTAGLAIVNLASSQDSGVQPFARGLNRDLDVIRQSAATDIVVVGYHFMSDPYLHDGLVNNNPAAERYRFLAERVTGEPTVYAGLADSVDELALSSGAEVWCVIPFEVGPDAAEQACRLDPAHFERIYSQSLSRSLITGWRLNA